MVRSIAELFLIQDRFWDKHPALLYGLTSLLSFTLALSPSPSLLLLLAAIILTSAASLRKLMLRILFLLGLNIAVFAYSISFYRLPELPAEGTYGRLHFELTAISTSETHFGTQTVMQGYGRHFEPGSQAKNFPCSIYLPNTGKLARPKGGYTYIVEGELFRSKGGSFFIVPDKSSPWIPANTSSLFAEKRFLWKQQVKTYLYRKISDSRSAEFLSGIVTGQFEDRVMRAEFGKLGLQHLMAISGFHFALLAGILAFFFRMFLPQKLTILILTLLMSSYFVFLGSSPSIVRAWFMSLAALVALALEKRSQALNALGAAFLFTLLYEPMLILTVGFQLSAAVTASILIFYPATKEALEKLMVKRSLSNMIKMKGFDQHCYCLLSILREGLALAIAVNIVAVPLTLFFFHKFPVMSLLYNLFIPLLVGGAMFLTLAASFFDAILPWLGPLFFSLANAYTHFVLNFIYNTPVSMNLEWRISEMPFALLLGYLSVIFFAGIWLRDKCTYKNNTGNIFI